MSRLTGWSMACVLLICGIVLLVGGCQRGSIKISPVIQGQKSPHKGYNIGPELWMEEGNPIKVTGVVLWIPGTDPNDLFWE